MTIRTQIYRIGIIEHDTESREFTAYMDDVPLGTFRFRGDAEEVIDGYLARRAKEQHLLEAMSTTFHDAADAQRAYEVHQIPEWPTEADRRAWYAILKQRQEVIASYSAARWAATTGAGFDAPWQHEYTLVHGEPFPQLPNDAPVITPPWDDDDNAAPAAIITDPDPDPKPPTPAAIRLPLPRTRDTAYSYHILKIAKRNGHLSLLLGSLSLRGLQVQAHIHSQALWKRGKKCPPEELLAFYYAITRMQACEVAA